MNYSPLTSKDKKEMLKKVKVESIKELFADIPKQIQRSEVPLKDGVCEMEALKKLKELAGQPIISFCGAGSYNHYIPAAVDHLSSRSEFYTAYTPYQPEVSQGTLIGIFEFQTMICNLTEMDVANASLYDGATASAEALLMILRKKRKNEALISKLLHPNYIEVLKTYCWANDITLHWIEEKEGLSSIQSMKNQMTDEIGAVMVQSPNFYGNIEELLAFSPKEIQPDRKKYSFSLIQVVNEPFSLALLKTGKSVGVSAVCGEASAFGNPQGFGGPGLGFLAVQSQYMRTIPGRLVGKTVDSNGDVAYALTLQTREQHIRREKASSNICSNEGLCALRASIFISLIGKEIIPVAKLNRDLAQKLKDGLIEAGFTAVYDKPIFNEFVLNVPFAKKFIASAQYKNIDAGIYLNDISSSFNENQMLFCATETTSPTEIEELIQIAKNHIKEL